MKKPKAKAATEGSKLSAETRVRLRGEMEQIRQRNGDGELRPEEIVSYAEKNPRSTVGQLLPDEQTCTHEYRLIWARNLIRVHVEELPSDGNGPVTVNSYVSLSSSRGDRGGYKPVRAVISNRADRIQLIMDLLVRLESIRELKLFSEFRPVLEAVATVRQRFPRPGGVREVRVSDARKKTRV